MINFSKDDPVYYFSPEGDTIPAVVQKVGAKRVQIKGNFLTGDRVVWVKPANLESQIQDSK